MHLQTPTTSPLGRGLEELQQALEYAADLQRDPWDFAVELHCLQTRGLTFSKLRWLVCKGYARHGVEQTSSETEGIRRFVESDKLTFSKRSCFILTQKGYEALCEMHGLGSRGTTLARSEYRSSPVGRPHWNGELHELTLGDRMIKRYRQCSPNQVTVLAAFEYAGWPAAIEDPLPVAAGVKRKKRLLETIRSLNSNQKCGIVRFLPHDEARRVAWELHGQKPGQ